MGTEFEQIVQILKLVGDKTRLTILLYLQERELCVCDLVELLHLSQPAISQHMRKLREAGLVLERREGTWAHFRLAPEIPQYVKAILSQAPSVSRELAQYIDRKGQSCDRIDWEGENNETKGCQ